MSLPPEILPTQHRKVIDLVQAAGLDVSNWANYKHGKANPGANPKYCYEWALMDPGGLVVCNLWYDSMKEVDGGVEQHLVLRDMPGHFEQDSTRRARRARMERVLAEAFQAGLSIRVIVLKDSPRKSTRGSKTVVRARALDPTPWSVIAYDPATSGVTLRRGSLVRYRDQFSLPIPPDGRAAVHTAVGAVRERSAEVRRYVLVRAGGNCELCGVRGFVLPDGSVYLETHHVKPLAEGGPDSVSNVVALCATHHREAHYGKDAQRIRTSLQEKLASHQRDA